MMEPAASSSTESSSSDEEVVVASRFAMNKKNKAEDRLTRSKGGRSVSTSPKLVSSLLESTRKSLQRSRSLAPPPPKAIVNNASLPPTTPKPFMREACIARSFRLEWTSSLHHKSKNPVAGCVLIASSAAGPVEQNEQGVRLAWFRGETEQDAVAVAGDAHRSLYKEQRKLPIANWFRGWYATTADDVGARIYARCTPLANGAPRWTASPIIGPGRDLKKIVETALRRRQLYIHDATLLVVSTDSAQESTMTPSRVGVKLTADMCEFLALDADTQRGLRLKAWDRDLSFEIEHSPHSDDAHYAVVIKLKAKIAARLISWFGDRGGDLLYAASIIQPKDSLSSKEPSSSKEVNNIVSLRLGIDQALVRDALVLTGRAFAQAAIAPLVRCARSELLALELAWNKESQNNKNKKAAQKSIDSRLREYAGRELELVAERRLAFQEAGRVPPSAPPLHATEADDPILHLPWRVASIHIEKTKQPGPELWARHLVSSHDDRDNDSENDDSDEDCSSSDSDQHATADNRKSLYFLSDDEEDDTNEDKVSSFQSNNGVSPGEVIEFDVLASESSSRFGPSFLSRLSTSSKKNHEVAQHQLEVAALRIELSARRRAEDATAAEVAASRAAARITLNDLEREREAAAQAQASAAAAAAAQTEAIARTTSELAHAIAEARRLDAAQKSLKAELTTRLHEQEGLVRVNRELRERVMLAEEEAEAFKAALEHHIVQEKRTVLSDEPAASTSKNSRRTNLSGGKLSARRRLSRALVAYTEDSLRNSRTARLLTSTSSSSSSRVPKRRYSWSRKSNTGTNKNYPSFNDDLPPPPPLSLTDDIEIIDKSNETAISPIDFKPPNKPIPVALLRR